MSQFHFNKMKLEMNVLEPANIAQFSTGGQLTPPSTSYLTATNGWTMSGGEIRQLGVDWGINKNVYQVRANGTGVTGAFSYTSTITAGMWIGAAITMQGTSNATYGRLTLQFLTGTTVISTQATNYELLVVGNRVRKTLKVQAPAGANGVKIIPQMSNASGGSPSNGQGFLFDAAVMVANVNPDLVNETDWYATNDNPNLFMNPIIDAQVGTAGWLPTSNVVEESYTEVTTGLPYLRVVHPSYLPVTGGVSIVSNSFPVNSGDKIAGFIDLKSMAYDGNGWDGVSSVDGAYVTLGFQYLDYNDNLLSNSGQTTATPMDLNVWKTVLTPQASVPTASNGTIQRARLIIRVWKDSAATLEWVSKNTGVMFKHAAIYKGTDVNEIAGLPFVEGYKYRDILCGTVEMSISRGEYDVQTLTAKIIDPKLNPATLSSLNQGTQIRWSGLNSDGQWVRMYTGKVSNFKADYINNEAVINVEAIDIMQDLANIKSKNNYIGIDPYFTGRSFFAQNDGLATSQIPNGSYPYSFQNDNASLLDQITTTRDSYRSYAWVDKNGVFQMWRKTLLEARPDDVLPIQFSDVHTDADSHQCYGIDADISFDPSRIINSFTVKRIEYSKVNDEEGNEEVVYGPYEDQTSISTYGARKAEITVGNYSNGANPDAYGAYVLGQYKDASIRMNRLTFEVDNQSSLDHATMIDTYSKVYVTNTNNPEINGFYRVTDIEHEVTTDHWYVTIGLMRPDDLPALTGGQPAPSTQNIGYIGSTTSTQMAGSFYMTASQFNKAVGVDQFVDFSSADRDDPQHIQNSAITFIIPKSGYWLVTWGIRANTTVAGYVNGALIDPNDQAGRRWAQVKVQGVAGSNNITGSAAVRFTVGQQLRLLCNAGGTGTYTIGADYNSTFISFVWLQD